jgi:hypothetical protein
MAQITITLTFEIEAEAEIAQEAIDGMMEHILEERKSLIMEAKIYLLSRVGDELYLQRRT